MAVLKIAIQIHSFFIFVYMARKKESGNTSKKKGEDLKADKEQHVSVTEIIKDERTHKITGVVLLLTGLILLLSFASYLFSWRQDQDKVLQGAAKFLFSSDEKEHVFNLLGRFGAYISHLFIYKGFGIASFLVCFLFFAAGINMIYGKKVFSVIRNIRYLIMGWLVLPVSFSFFLGRFEFAWGGMLGKYLENQLSLFLGNVGTAILLTIAATSYIIWRFNPVFRLPQKKQTAEPVLPVTEDLPEEAEEPKEDPLPKEKEKKSEGNVLLPLITNQESTFDNPTPVSQEEDSKKYALELTELPEQEQEEQPAQPILPLSSEESDSDSLALEIKVADPEPAVDSEGSVVENLPPYDPFLDLKDYKFPSLSLLENHGSEKIVQDPKELENYKNQIINTLRNYDIEIQKISATVGPTVTLYEIVPAAGVRISKIKNLEDDIALSLSALGIRIIAPIPGKGTIGIEVPNVKKTVVSMKTLLSSEKFQHAQLSLPIAIGKQIDNENYIVDLASMPHLLMAGATGQGKSVGLNAILVSLLYKKHPSQLKLVLVDPKKVELSLYRHIERHFLAKLPGEEESIITDTKKVINTLNALCIEMDNRYDLLKEAGCRNIKEYNEKFVARKLNPQKGHQYLPFIVLVIDEFADLIMTAGKEVETPIARLAQLARAIGIHLIIATQRPSVNIITGTIKANFPARIAFKVSSKVDSRTILDTGGAEQLIGRGDMLISNNGNLTRLQCAFVDTPEVDEIVSFISKQRGYPQPFLLPEYTDEKELEGKDFDMNDRDSLFEDAARVIVQNQVGSTSLLQRRMKLGYNRAGRLMDQLEAAGIVGASQGSKAREVLVKTEADLDSFLRNNL
jgi:S-DNA-T family DNA segregation ATPase FtsK/SpoIIIE